MADAEARPDRAASSSAYAPPATYARLRRAYLREPGNHRAAAAAAGVGSWKVAKRIWDQGLPSWPPLRVVVACRLLGTDREA